MEIHYGLTFWLWGEKTSKLGANMNLIVIHIVVILQIPNQMWIIMRKNTKVDSTFQP
jgi:hypothetical protein